MNGQVGSVMLVRPAVLRSVVCCSCQKSFFGRGCQEPKICNPYLLICGHSVCQSCCLRMKTGVISCGVCGTGTKLPCVNGSTLNLPRNAYLLGMMHLGSRLNVVENISYKISKKQENTDSQKIFDINYLEESFVEFCYECSKVHATLACQQCDCHFCDACWNKVHSSGKSLQKHLRRAKNTFRLENCKIHGKKLLEFFCNNCNICICPDCVVLNHQGENHKTVTLQEKNYELFKEVNQLKKEVNLNMKRMCDASKEVMTLKRKVSRGQTSYENLQRQVVQNFAYLHGVVQVAEESVLRQLEAAKNEKRDRLEEILLQLNGQIETIKGVMGKIENLKDPEPLQRDLLLERIRDTLITLKNLPSRLVTSKDPGKDTSNESPAVSFDETVIQSLKNYCTLNIPTNGIIELKNEVSDGVVFYCPEQLKEEEELVVGHEILREDGDTNDDASENSNCSDDWKKFAFHACSINSSMYPLSVSPISKVKSVDVVEGNEYPVILSYVKDPGEFFVMRTSLQKQRQKINMLAPVLAAKARDPQKNVEIGEYYLVQYAVDNKWYRGRVIDVLPDRNENNEIVAVVYYLDYGNKQEVPLSRLREMPKTLSCEPPLAIKCRLYSCMPTSGTWCKESTKVMLDVLDKSPMTMFVMKVLPDCLEVDLCWRGNDDSFDDELISFRDMMVFFEYAFFAAGSDSMKKKMVNLKYLIPVMPNTESFRGLITYSESESLFYVQKIGPETQYLLTLMNRLDSIYNRESVKGLIYNPDFGMPCAAVYAQDGKWYRGEIIGFRGHERVTVYYVDYGNKDVLHWKFVRKLKPEFLKLSPQAIPCSLAKLPHRRGAKWKPNVKDCLERYSSEILRVHVAGKKGRKLSVVLYTSKNVCINDEMLEISNGNGAPDSSMASTAIELGFSAVDEARGIETNGKRKNVRERKKAVSNREEMSKDSDEIFRTEVKVLRATSPSDIYVSLVCFSSRAEDLERELQEFYGTCEVGSGGTWEVDDRCAAFSCEREKWYRAIISKILDNGKIRVLFKDIMMTEDVPVSNIRVLDERFLAFPIGAIKCHLSGIFPPEQEWPGLTCEFLQSQLDLYKNVYMTKMGEIEDNSLPIQLWVKKHTQGGALEPSTVEWVVLNDLIVEQGLAVPKKAKLVHHLIAEDGVEPEDEVDGNTKFKAGFSPDVTDETEDSFVNFASCGWLPPELCRKDRFIGQPTYVNSDGVIYLHDMEDEPIMDQIRVSLLQFYQDSEPRACDQHWSVGRPCIVRYHLDGGWYRGMVLQVNDDCTYQVLFIDYGNSETCRVADMRKDVKHLEIPTLAKACVLHGLSPVSEDGRWPREVIDDIYRYVVEERFEVTLVEKSTDPCEPNKVILRMLKNNINVNEELVRLGLAEFISDGRPNAGVTEELALGKSCAVPQVPDGKFYSQLEIPCDCKIFPIEVLIVKDSELIGHILDHESIPVEIRRIISDFVSLTDEIQGVAESQEKLEDFSEGVPCISLYSNNGTWYRAEVLRFDSDRDLVLVRYVDYGNEEHVTKDRIRKCLRKWFNVRTMALNLKLHNVRMCEGVKKSDYLERLLKCLSQPGLIVEVVDRNRNQYVVEVKREGSLAYQEMIDDGLMEFAEKTEIVSKVSTEKIENSS